MQKVAGRGSNADFQRFLHMAMGSASELEYHLLLSRDLHFLEGRDHDRVHTQIVEVKRMMASLIRKIEAERRP